MDTPTHIEFVLIQQFVELADKPLIPILLLLLLVDLGEGADTFAPHHAEAGGTRQELPPIVDDGEVGQQFPMPTLFIAFVLLLPLLFHCQELLVAWLALDLVLDAVAPVP